jgi:hypothetical protein
MIGHYTLDVTSKVPITIPNRAIQTPKSIPALSGLPLTPKRTSNTRPKRTRKKPKNVFIIND